MREFTSVHISPLVTKEPVRNQIRNIGIYIYICTLSLFIEDILYASGGWDILVPVLVERVVLWII